MATSRWWRTGFAVSNLLIVTPLWLASYPPLTDLPQHAAQIAIGRGWLSGSALYHRLYEPNPYSIQVVAYALVLALSYVVSIVPAVKAVLSLALVATTVAVSRALREAGADPWWVFLVFPTLYGYSMGWGFLSFVVAVPLGWGLVLLSVRYARQPDTRRLGMLALTSLVLFLTHVLVLGWAALVAVLVLLVRARRAEDRWRGVAAVAWIAPVVLVWMLGSARLPAFSVAHPVPYHQGNGPGPRVPELLAFSIGRPESIPAWIAGAALFALPFVMGGRPRRLGWRWIPFLVTLALYLVSPLHAFGTAFLYPRAATFLLPALLLALEPGRTSRSTLRGVAVAIAVGWGLWIALQYHRFDVESRPVADLLRRADPGGRLLSLVGDPSSRAVPTRPYAHFAQWYQVERGGAVDFSFAEYFPNRFRYRPEKDPPLPGFVEWDPARFVWAEHGGELYDYFLVRKRRGDVTWTPFAGATTDIREIARHGSWALYRQDPTRAPSTPATR